MKKIVATITVLAVAVLPIATASSASAITMKRTAVVSIGGYCC